MESLWLVEYSENYEGQKKLFKRKEDAYNFSFKLYEQDYRGRLEYEIANFGLNPYNPNPEPENFERPPGNTGGPAAQFFSSCRYPACPAKSCRLLPPPMAKDRASARCHPQAR